MVCSCQASKSAIVHNQCWPRGSITHFPQTADVLFVSGLLGAKCKLRNTVRILSGSGVIWEMPVCIGFNRLIHGFISTSIILCSL